jgi:hypothetical protein
MQTAVVVLSIIGVGLFSTTKRRSNPMKTSIHAALAASALIFSTTAIAGEVTGGPNPKGTAAPDHARSICAFSGQEDGITLVGFTNEGFPIFITVDTGPGLVQNPHQENAADIIHPPGIPGDACRGNAGSEL